MSEKTPEAVVPASVQDTIDAGTVPGGGTPARADDASSLLRPAEADGEIGRLGPFRVFRLLGEGGMGAVFAAEDPLLRRKVALKVMRPELTARPEARERFVREAQAAAAVESDFIVPVHQVGDDNGVLFIAMPLLKGEALDDRLKRDGRLSIAATLKVAREVAEGLAAAHAAGLVHRDIKPANIWLEGDGPHGFNRVRVLDFGLARPVDDAHLTGNAIVGTPAYMSLEQARGQPVDARTDLFSLGGVFYRVLTGRPPFQGETAMEVLLALATEDPPPVRSLNPGVPESLAALVHQLLAKSADARPPSAAAVLDRLRALVEELAATRESAEAQPRAVYVPVQMPSAPEASPFADIDSHATELDSDNSDEHDDPSDPEPIASKSRRWRWAALGSLVLALVVGGVIVAKTRGGRDTPAKPTDGGAVAVSPLPTQTSAKTSGLPLAPMPRPDDPDELEFRLKAGESIVSTLALTPGGTRLVAGYSDGYLRVWDLTTRKLDREHEIGDSVYSLAIHPDGKTVAVSTESGRLLTWNLETGAEVRRYIASPLSLSGSWWNVGFANDGKLLLAPHAKSGVLLGWDTTTGVRRVVGHFEPGRHAFLSVTERGDAVLVGSEGAYPRVLKVATGEQIWEASWRIGTNIPGVSADGERACFSSHHDAVPVCSRGKLKPDAVFSNQSEGYWQTAFSLDGRLVVAARGEVCVWSLAGGQAPTLVLRDRVGSHTHRVAFTPNGERLITASHNGTICVYRVSKSWGERRKP